jgi:hypothetical protein
MIDFIIISVDDSDISQQGRLHPSQLREMS